MSELPRLLMARTVSLGYEHPACGTYLAQLSVQISQSGLFSKVEWPVITNTRILDARNTTVHIAKKLDCQYLLIIDPDMQPDIELGEVDTALPFFHSSFQFLTDLKAGNIEGMPKGSLGIVGAPAMSGPPDFKPNVMVYDKSVKCGFRRVVHEECLKRTAQIERVFTIGTGVMLIPMDVFDNMEPPYFDDEYRDPDKRFVWCSQDFGFCMKCNKRNVSVWCNWYAWARHWKLCPVDRPNLHLMNYLKSNLKSAVDDVREDDKCKSQLATATGEQTASPAEATLATPDKSSTSLITSSSSSTAAPIPDFLFQGAGQSL